MFACALRCCKQSSAQLMSAILSQSSCELSIFWPGLSQSRPGMMPPPMLGVHAQTPVHHQLRGARPPCFIPDKKPAWLPSLITPPTNFSSRAVLLALLPTATATAAAAAAAESLAPDGAPGWKVFVERVTCSASENRQHSEAIPWYHYKAYTCCWSFSLSTRANAQDLYKRARWRQSEYVGSRHVGGPSFILMGILEILNAFT
eukprot:1161271-Pelagomonas_calceolata.AAC.3